MVVASWAAHHEHYTWISTGAYIGYLTLIVFDLNELRRRAAELYGIGRPLAPANAQEAEAEAVAVTEAVAEAADAPQ